MAVLRIGVLSSVVILCLIYHTQGAVFTQHSAIHPAHPGKCFDKITRKFLLPNKEYRPKGICAAMTCDIKSSTINIETCPYIDMPECEELKTDLSWSFPKCCAQFLCKDFKTGKNVIVSL